MGINGNEIFCYFYCGGEQKRHSTMFKIRQFTLKSKQFFIFDWYQYNSLAPNWLKVRTVFHTNNSGEQAETELSSLLGTYFSLST